MSKYENLTGLRSDLRDSFLRAFPEDRVKTLLAYGSMIDGRSTNSDVDTYLLLDSWAKDDVITAKEACDAIDAPVDLTLHYKDELPENPGYFRLGKKSCLALGYLASADLLHGKNVPASMFEDLPHRAMQKSALHVIFYYLGQMRKEVSTIGDTDMVNQRMDKYMARSIIDAMMFYKKMTYQPFRRLSPQDVVEMAREHPQIGNVFHEVEEIDTNPGKLELMHKMHNQLRMANWLISREEEVAAIDESNQYDSAKH